MNDKNQLTLFAHGKINLGLDVLGRRNDGYHMVRMIMQTVSLADEVTLTKTDAPGITMTCDTASLPTNQDNLCMRAAYLLFDRYSLTGGLHINLKKRIFVAAGMAGGSTDAAAVFMGINRLYDLGLDQKTLQDYGVTLGADIPYCMLGNTALSEGIGEVLTPITPMHPYPVLIAKPPVGVSTKVIYEALDALSDYPHPDIDGLMEAIAADDLTKICKTMGNVLAEVTEPMVPEIKTIRSLMTENGAKGAMMTGSGPTVFGLFASEEQRDICKDVLERSGLCQGVYGGSICTVSDPS